MSNKQDAPKPDQEAASKTSRSTAREQAVLEERRQVIRQYASQLKEFLARLLRKSLH